MLWKITCLILLSKCKLSLYTLSFVLVLYFCQVGSTYVSFIVYVLIGWFPKQNEARSGIYMCFNKFYSEATDAV